MNRFVEKAVMQNVQSIASIAFSAYLRAEDVEAKIEELNSKISKLVKDIDNCAKWQDKYQKQADNYYEDYNNRINDRYDLLNHWDYYELVERVQMYRARIDGNHELIKNLELERNRLCKQYNIN